MTTTEASTDGRRLRRDRNRQAVVEALLELYRGGQLSPSADQIAERAGISARSLFRYFDDIDALVHTAVERQQQHLAPLYALRAKADQDLPARIDQFVADRFRLLEGMGYVGQVARGLAPTQPVIAAELTRVRAALRSQVQTLFADALDAADPSERPALAAAVDVACSWEVHHLLRTDQGLSGAAARRVMVLSLRRLLLPRGGT
jgi:AcrR family transcriptional regulator